MVRTLATGSDPLRAPDCMVPCDPLGTPLGESSGIGDSEDLEGRNSQWLCWCYHRLFCWANSFGSRRAACEWTLQGSRSRICLRLLFSWTEGQWYKRQSVRRVLWWSDLPVELPPTDRSYLLIRRFPAAWLLFQCSGSLSTSDRSLPQFPFHTVPCTSRKPDVHDLCLSGCWS